MTQMVRYRVKKPVFVNGSIHRPVKGRDVFVDAVAGLAGPALEPITVVKTEQAGQAGRAGEGHKK